MRKLAKRAMAVLLAMFLTVEALPAPVKVYADEPAPVTGTIVQEDNEDIVKEAETDKNGPEAAEPENTEAEPEEPKAAETGVTEPATTEAEPAEPKAAETEVTEPAATEAELSEPKAAETEMSEPAATEAEPAEPKAAEAEVTEPAATEAEPAQPKAAGTEMPEPAAAEPKAAKATGAEPETAEPKAAKATGAEPETAEPKAAEAKGTEPETTEEEAAVKKAEKADDASAKKPGETDTAGPLSLETKVDDVTVKVDAEEGAFPEGAGLVAEIANTEQEKEATEAVDEVRPENTNVAVSYTFDIKIVDTEGNELQPEEGRKVNICFELDRAADNNLTADVYHLEETETTDAADQTESEASSVLEAEKLDSETDREGSSVTAVTDGFSLYTVEFTYKTLQYVLEGGEKTALSTILSNLNLAGSVEAVEVSNTELFSAGNETGEWIITSHKSFNTNEWMKVSIDGVVYEITVTDTESSVNSWSGLQSAIDGANDGDVIKISDDAPSELVCDNNERLALTTGKSITIDLNNKTINRGFSTDYEKNMGHVFDFPRGTVTIQNGTITGGIDENGGGIVVGGEANLTLNNIIIKDNTAKSGGGIFAYEGSTITLDNVTIENNNATDWGGGGINNKGTATLTNCTLQNNAAGNEGGGIYNGTGGLTLTNCTVTGNTAPGGGGICCFGTVNMEGTEISGNHASENGGGLAVHGILTMSGADNSITGNTASNDGGGIFLTGSAGIVSMTGGGIISDNTASDGGGVYNEGGTITFTGVEVSGNQSTQYGGAGINNKGTATLDSCSISTNTAASDGAGIYSEGLLNITGSTFENNVTQSSGGALRVFSNVATLTNCTMKSNTASNYGGAICVSDSGTVSIVGGDTITENTAYNGGSGMWLTGDGPLNITGVNTINKNVASDIYLTVGKVITITGSLGNGTQKSQIGVMLEKQSGIFTSDYDTYNSGVDPAEYFIPETGCSVIKDGDECKIIASKWGYIQYLINNSDDAINLDSDIIAAPDDTTLTVPAGKTVTINLNGHKLDRGLSSFADNGEVLTVNGTLVVTDTVGGGKICGGYGSSSGGVCVSTGGDFTLDGGSITGNTGTTFAGGICVYTGGTATIKAFEAGKGGRVEGNSGPLGGGIYNSGTLNIENGAVISNNNATENGGGICIRGGTVNLKGGSITGNTAVNEGGGIWNGESGSILTVNGAPDVTGNSSAVGNNIMLKKQGAGHEDENVIGVTKLTDDTSGSKAKLDISTTDLSAPLTGELDADSSAIAADVFTYNGTAYGSSLEIRNGNKLYHKDVSSDVTVSNWAALQDEINKPANQDKVIGLADDISADNNDKYLLLDGKNVIIELNGHNLNRNLLDYDGDGNVFRLTNDSSLTIRDSLGTGVITGGYSDDDGGAIYITDNSTCTIESGVIKGNKAGSDGGAIYIDEGSLITKGGTITGNYAKDTGGAIYCDGDGFFDISNAIISSNISENAGGAFNVHNSAKISNSRIVNNKSNTEDGGAIRMDASDNTLEISNTVIQGNFADDDGGGIYLESGKIVMKGGELSDNSGSDAGGIMVTSDTEFSAEGVSILRNTSRDESGGGVNNHGKTTLSNCDISYNVSNVDAGGGVYNRSDITITNCTFTGNSAKCEGGAVFSKDNARIENCTFDSNHAAQGGGIYQGTSDSTEITIINPVMTNNTVVSNSDDNLLGKGGAIYIEDGDTTIDGGSITGNSADFCGGGIYADDDFIIKGKLVVKDNFSDNVYLDDVKLKTGALIKDETVTGAQIFVTLNDEDGTFTERVSGC